MKPTSTRTPTSDPSTVGDRIRPAGAEDDFVFGQCSVGLGPQPRRKSGTTDRTGFCRLRSIARIASISKIRPCSIVLPNWPSWSSRSRPIRYSVVTVIRYFATCARGLEPILAGRASRPRRPGRFRRPRRRRVRRRQALLYKANLWLRTAVRVLRPVLEAPGHVARGAVRRRPDARLGRSS